RGEPVEPENHKDIYKFIQDFKKQYPCKTVWCYSGFTFEEITGIKKSRAFTDISTDILSLTDVLVDGKFINAQKNISLKFRGSENQRIIDVKKTLKNKKIELYLD
ncbi:MAG: radical SAM protein, partial [Clostridiales bacterium]|nr:radical SAM protein [Clostridiales bacterium]